MSGSTELNDILCYISLKPWQIAFSEAEYEEILSRETMHVLDAISELVARDGAHLLFLIVWNDLTGDWNRSIPFFADQSSRAAILKYMWLLHNLGLPGTTKFIFESAGIKSPNMILSFRAGSSFTVSCELRDGIPLVRITLAGDPETFKHTCSFAFDEKSHIEVEEILTFENLKVLRIVKYKCSLYDRWKTQFQTNIDQDLQNKTHLRMFLNEILRAINSSYTDDRTLRELYGNLALIYDLITKTSQNANQNAELVYFFNSSNIIPVRHEGDVPAQRDGGCLVLLGKQGKIPYKEYYLISAFSLAKLSSAQKIFRIRAELNHALRSAVAAIMARNMSHLLGSHIEPGIQNDLISLVKTVSRSELLRSTKGWPPNGDVAEQIKKVARYGWPQAFKEACEEAFRGDKDKYNLLELLYRIQQKALDRYALYRQRRMDFIARVATDWPAWGVGFDFYINFVRPFLANSILLHFVGYSDGVHLDWLDFDVHIGDSKVTERYTPQQGQPIVLSPLDMAVSWGVVESEGRARYSSRPHNYTPVTVWSRGGDMAVQAFHVILENIIRNSIKHCLPSIKSNKKLRIGIRLFQTYPELSGAVKCPEGLRLKASDDLVYVVISSDADCPDKATDLDQKICEPVTKETGEREPGNWGMKEIKIAAALLGNRGLEEVNNPNPDFVQICKVQMPKENGQVVEQLGYCLTLPRFYYVGILKQGAGDVVSASE
jgi:hypothetical protein